MLIAGIGGGYDLFCGLPIYFELRERGQSVHLANLSFSQLRWLKDGIALAEGLTGVTAASRTYFRTFRSCILPAGFRRLVSKTSLSGASTPKRHGRYVTCTPG